jgi:hypothetical protein
LPKEKYQVGVKDVALMVWSPKKLRGSNMIVKSLGRSFKTKCDTICK